MNAGAGGDPAGVAGPSGADEPALDREVSFVLLVLYGLGTTVGAGIYALTGKVAGEAGMRAPLAFVVAASLAASTALGFAELAGRLPRAAGEAVFVHHAFHRRALTAVIGTAVLVAGVVAAAAITNAFAGYVSELVDAPRWLLVAALIALLSAVAVVGAKEAVSAAGLVTVVEVAGLGLVLWYGRRSLGDAGEHIGELLGPPETLDAWRGVMAGAFLAFFAFLGFEDIDSIAEETEDATRTLPRAILATLGLTAILYLAVSTVSVLTVDPAALADSDAPMALVFARSGGNPDILTAIAALAMINGALVQLVMVPRVGYGLTRLGLLPGWVGAVSARTHTPVRGTLLAAAVIVVLALGVDLAPLARLTSATTMGVFVAVNVSLVAIKRQDGPHHGFQVPMWMPVVGVGASGALFVSEGLRLVG